MNLSEHFTLEEFVFSETAVRLGIDNNPSPEIQEHLKVVATNLETVRTLLGTPIRITSGYRSVALNAKIPGSSNTSAHTLGWAADFVSPQFGTPLQVCQKVAASGIKYDQMIHEFGTWTHLSFDTRMRQMDLTIWKGSGGYKPGIIPIPS